MSNGPQSPNLLWERRSSRRVASRSADEPGSCRTTYMPLFDFIPTCYRWVLAPTRIPISEHSPIRSIRPARPPKSVVSDSDSKILFRRFSGDATFVADPYCPRDRLGAALLLPVAWSRVFPSSYRCSLGAPTLDVSLVAGLGLVL